MDQNNTRFLLKILLVRDIRIAAMDAYCYKLDDAGNVLSDVADFLMNHDDVAEDQLVRFRNLIEQLKLSINELNKTDT